MGVEGGLRIALDLSGEQDRYAVSGVTLQSNRPVHAASVLQGKSLAETLQTLPLLFSVCAQAQACASVRALENAKSVSSGTQAEHVRLCLVDLETLHEHLWRILLDWPELLGEPPQRTAMAEMAGLRREFGAALNPLGEAFAFGGSALECDAAVMRGLWGRLLALLERALFGVPPAEWLNLATCADLKNWSKAQETLAARMLRQILESGWAGAGACHSAALPRLLSGSELASALRERSFVERPQWRGECCETSALSRSHSPLLADLKTRFGNGLLSRLAATLHEVARLAVNLLVPGRIGPDAMANSAGLGIGQVAAARGQLVHRVALDQHDRVIDYRILAPTEWNFHPRGVVVNGLAALTGSKAEIEQQARLLVTVIDPCVGYDLQLQAKG